MPIEQMPAMRIRRTGFSFWEGTRQQKQHEQYPVPVGVQWTLGWKAWIPYGLLLAEKETEGTTTDLTNTKTPIEEYDNLEEMDQLATTTYSTWKRTLTVLGQLKKLNF